MFSPAIVTPPSVVWSSRKSSPSSSNDTSPVLHPLASEPRRNVWLSMAPETDFEPPERQTPQLLSISNVSEPSEKSSGGLSSLLSPPGGPGGTHTPVSSPARPFSFSHPFSSRPSSLSHSLSTSLSSASLASSGGLSKRARFLINADDDDDFSEAASSLAPSGAASSNFRTARLGGLSSQHMDIVVPGAGVLGTHAGGVIPATPSEHEDDDIVNVESDRGSGSGSSSNSTSISSPPTFDVRASFAPMPRFAPTQAADRVSWNPTYAGLQRINGGGGISHAGREWSGLTAHAVEQEMEALADESIMSYAPDPAYLASRLEGVRKNLEIEGDEGRRKSYIEYPSDLGEAADAENDEKMDLDEVEAVVAEVHKDAAMPHLPHSPTRPSRSLLRPDPEGVLIAAHKGVPMSELPSLSQSGRPMQSPEAKAAVARAKAAALDARIEVRNLKRTDLEQVREMNCLHGEGELIDRETYTTSASFLIRLLVDSSHVCLVAIAKPLPAPADPLPDLHRTSDSHQSFGESLVNDGNGAVSDESGGVSPINPHDDFGPSSAGSGTTSSHESSMQSFSGRGARIGHSAETVSSALTSVPDDDDCSVAGEGDADATASSGSEQTATVANTAALRARMQARAGGPTKGDQILIGPNPKPFSPPRAVRVMAVPPPRTGTEGGSSVETETVLGVASATLKRSPVVEDPMWIVDGDVATKGAPPLWEAHVLTLSVAHSERGQGLGARLLDRLIEECKSRAEALNWSDTNRRGRRAGVFSSGGPAAAINAAAGKAADATQTAAATDGPLTAPVRLRTFLEVHPSNKSAIALYESRGFVDPPVDDWGGGELIDDDDTAAGEGGKRRTVKRNYFRGDARIPVSERLKRGGTDAWVLERLD